MFFFNNKTLREVLEKDPYCKDIIEDYEKARGKNKSLTRNKRKTIAGTICRELYPHRKRFFCT